MDDVVKVLTQKSLLDMLAIGGSGHWKANKERVQKCRYVVAVNNGRAGWADDNQAFLIGKISGVTAVPAEDNRLIIHFDEYAEIAVPDAWEGNRNPVTYTSLEALKIDPETLEWRPVPETAKTAQETAAIQPLTIDQAKLGLARALGIGPDCIEITIRA
ncbi:MAG: hypothetical protein DYG91_14260 [Chloroflexi bacterium CFX7]|nr:hypothetical protein [Chloroflexi bacterium CFX7]